MPVYLFVCSVQANHRGASVEIKSPTPAEHDESETVQLVVKREILASSINSSVIGSMESKFKQRSL